MRAGGLLLTAALVLAACKPTATVDNAQGARALPPEVTISSGLQLAGRVTDAAHILTQQEITSLRAYLSDFEEHTKHQMVVVTVPSLEGKSIDAYTLELANRWGIGRKGVSDGIVLLVAPNERRVRIEIGKGLETTLTNDYCAQVISRMTPFFKNRHFYDGIMEGLKGLSEKAS
jgi:uncharacterized protein